MTEKEKPVRDERGEKFVADLFADWEAHGRGVLETLRTEKPADYVRIAAAVLPKEKSAKPEPIDELTDAELFERIVRVAARAGFEVRAAAAVGREGPTDNDEAARG